MSKKLRALLSSVPTDKRDAEFTVMPMNESLLQSITGGNTNYTCTNSNCGSETSNSKCTNNSCSGTRDGACSNQR